MKRDDTDGRVQLKVSVSPYDHRYLCEQRYLSRCRLLSPLQGSKEGAPAGAGEGAEYSGEAAKIIMRHKDHHAARRDGAVMGQTARLPTFMRFLESHLTTLL